MQADLTLRQAKKNTRKREENSLFRVGVELGQKRQKRFRIFAPEDNALHIRRGEQQPRLPSRIRIADGAESGADRLHEFPREKRRNIGAPACGNNHGVLSLNKVRPFGKGGFECREQ